MIDEEEYFERRHKLAEFVTAIHPNQVDVELAIFDLLYSTKKNRINKENEALEKLYLKIKNESPSILDFKTALKDYKTTFKHDTAYSIVLIYGNLEDYDYNKHYGKFKKNNSCINKYIGDKHILPNLELLAEQDGAIILDNKGMIQAVNTFLTNITFNSIPESQLHLYNNAKERSDPKFYGFKQDVSTRHLSAIGASYTMPKVITYTLGENMDKTTPEQTKIEHGQIRRYELGLISLSTLFSEEKITTPNQKYLIETLNQAK